MAPADAGGAAVAQTAVAGDRHTAALIPEARRFVDAGGVIDCRDPERIAFVDPRESHFESHLGEEAIDAELRECPDQELRSMLTGGVVLKAGINSQVVIKPNLLSLYSAGEGVGLDAVVDELHSLVGRSWYSTHQAFIPFIPWRCAPRGVVPRPHGGVPRGIVDNGAPRTELLTWPRGEVVVPTNEAAGPMRPPPGTPPDAIKWHQEVKPFFADAGCNGAILADIARRAGLPVFAFAFDFKYYFH